MTTKEKNKASDNNRELLIKGVFLLVLAIFLFAVYKNNDAPNVSMDAFKEGLINETDLKVFEECNARDLKQFIGLEPDQYDSFVYYKGAEALSVDEILIIKANSKSGVDDIRDAIDKRVAEQTKAFDSYGPEQVKRLGNAVVLARGRYVFYCVAKNTAQYEEVFRHVV